MVRKSLRWVHSDKYVGKWALYYMYPTYAAQAKSQARLLPKLEVEVSEQMV
jgi:hypothetical protein